jgi:hypothetical protein
MQQAYKSTDLQPEDRRAVERLVGRRLQSDEAVRVTILKVDDMAAAEDAERRRAAASRIRELAKGKRLGGATVRDLIDEGRRF